MTFTIQNETNNITAHASVHEARAVTNAERFDNEAALAKLAANWPTSRLIEIWNSLPGATPVKKFTDRTKAVGRIWKAIQGLGESTSQWNANSEIATPFAEVPAPTRKTAANDSETLQVETAHVGEQAPDVAPAEDLATRKASPKKNAPAGETVARAPREGSKTGQVIALLKRKEGVTLEHLMTTMGWQKHTTRALLSAGGSLTKKHGLIVTSEKVGAARTYFLKD